MLFDKTNNSLASAEAGKTMVRLFKLLMFLLVIGFVGLVGYAYVGEFFGANFSPQQTETRMPVTLDAE